MLMADIPMLKTSNSLGVENIIVNFNIYFKISFISNF